MSIEKRMNNTRVYLGLIISLVSVFHSFVFPVNAETIQQKNVLLLHADNPLLPANIMMDHKFNTILKLTNPRPVALYSEYLEIVRFRSEIIEKKTLDLLKEKYSKLNLDLIIITDDQSWDFMIVHGKDVFPETSIVFCGITVGKIDVNTLKPNVTGNFKRLDVESNFENILHIQPNTTEIYVIVGTSEQDAFYETFACNAAIEYEKKVKITFVKGLSIEDTQKKISNLPDGTAVFYIAMYQDGTGMTFNPRDALTLLNKTANVPIYAPSDTYLGHGMVGGNLLSFADFSENAAEIALQVLNGKSPAEIPAVVSPNKNYFDFKEMQRWGIHEKNLPQGSILINKQPGLWDLYRWQIISAISIVISGLLLIIYLTFQIHSKRKARAEVLKLNFKLENTNQMLEADIAERIQAEQSLAENEARLRILLQTIPDLIWLKDVEGVYLFCNPMFERLYGASETDIVGKTDYDFVDKEQADFFRMNDGRAMAAGKPSSNEEWLTFADNDYRGLFDTIKTPMWNSDGKLIGVLGIAHDITRRKRDEEEKVKLKAQLQQAQKMEAIGSLAGGIAHDLNNILFPISGLSEMLLDDIPPDNPAHESMEQIYKSAQRGSDLVKQILAFSRQSNPRKLPIRIQPILKEVLKLARATIPRKIEITSHIQANCGMVSADPTQVHQIMMNLITNAYHAVEQAGGTIHIALKETDMRFFDEKEEVPFHAMPPDGTSGCPLRLLTDKYACITLSDTGTGMDQTLINRIFEPYFTTKEQGKGTGLGLSVVHGIIKEHGGDIRVYSEVGKGTVFHAYLPLLEDAGNHKTAAVARKYPTGRESILLVDDEELIVSMEQMMLERLGYQVTVRTSSPDALDAFRADPSKFDLVISDRGMPNMTGEQLAGELFSIRPDIPIILCTGFSDANDEQRAKDMGIKGFLMKPVATGDLATMVRKVLDEAAERA